MSECVFHIIPYVDWANGLRTTCCNQRVTDLPVTDACGPRWSMRERGQVRCPGAWGPGRCVGNHHCGDPGGLQCACAHVGSAT